MSDPEVEDPAHLAELVRQKAEARKSRGIDRLRAAAPSTHQLLIAAAERGEALGGITSALLGLLDRYGSAELEAAVVEALAAGVPHPRAVRQCLERRRQQRELPPMVAVTLPDDPRVRELTVRLHDLADYDLTAPPRKEDDDDDHR